MKISFHVKCENTKKESKTEYYSDSDDNTTPIADFTISVYGSDSNESIESEPEVLLKLSKNRIKRKQHEQLKIIDDFILPDNIVNEYSSNISPPINPNTINFEKTLHSALKKDGNIL